MIPKHWTAILVLTLACSLGAEQPPRVIDTDSGIGTQFAVTDANGDGLLDVAVSNKKGTFLFEQVRPGR